VGSKTRLGNDVLVNALLSSGVPVRLTAFQSITSENLLGTVLHAKNNADNTFRPVGATVLAGLAHAFTEPQGDAGLAFHQDPTTGSIFVGQGVNGTYAQRWHQALFYEEGSNRADPTWTTGLVTAPGAGAAIVTIAAQASLKTRLWGITYGDDDSATTNFFEIRDGVTVKQVYNKAQSQGAPFQARRPIVIGTANTTFTVNVTNAGVAGKRYSAAILTQTSA